jgi:NhaP-type Na+/H+ or K+/H+ antiporter
MKHLAALVLALVLAAHALPLSAQFASGPGAMTGTPYASENYLYTTMHSNQYQVVVGHRRAVLGSLALGGGIGLLGRSETSDMFLAGADAQLGLVAGDWPISATASYSRFSNKAPTAQEWPGGESFTVGLVQQVPVSRVVTVYLHSRWEHSDQTGVCKYRREAFCAPWSGLRGEVGLSYAFLGHTLSWGVLTGDPLHAHGGAYMRLARLR